MRNKVIPTLTLGLLLICLYPASTIAAITLPFSDGFESYTVGSPPPAPWRGNEGGPGIVTDVQAHNSQKSVVVSGGPYSCDSSVVDLEPNFTDFLQYEAWAYYSTGSYGKIGFHEQFGNMLASYNFVYFEPYENGGHVTFWGANGVEYEMAIISPGWHHVLVQLNFQDEVGSVWLDETQLLDSVPITSRDGGCWPGYACRPLRYIGFSHYGGTVQYYDDFSLKEFAKCSLSGTVTDKKTGNPIRKAKAKLKRCKGCKDKTDENGDYMIDDIKCGTYKLLKVRKGGYKRYKEIGIQIEGKVVRNIELEKKK